MFYKVKQSIKAVLFLCWYQLNKKKFGYLAPSAKVSRGVSIYNKKNLFMYDGSSLYPDSVIMNTRGKVVIKKKSGSAIGLTIITGNHISSVGTWRKDITDEMKDALNAKADKDVIVEEDVWLGANVTLLSGTKIGRGAIIGTGSVVRSIIPPYAIAIGNPAKIIGFCFTPDEIVEHESYLYPIEERLPKELLEKNHQKYFMKRIQEIKNILK